MNIQIILKKLLKLNKSIIIRIPIISGINDNKEEMLAIKSFFDKNGYSEKVELLPYHSLGEHKYSAIGKEAVHFLAPSKSTLDELKKHF